MPHSRMVLLKFLPNKDKYVRFMTFRLQKIIKHLKII